LRQRAMLLLCYLLAGSRIAKADPLATERKREDRTLWAWVTIGRRELLAALGGAAAGWPPAARAASQRGAAHRRANEWHRDRDGSAVIRGGVSPRSPHTSFSPRTAA